MAGGKEIDTSRIERYDQADMLGRILSLPDQLARAHSMSKNPELVFGARDISNICIAGMGGSAISGDVARALFRAQLSVPVTVSRSYALPGFVNEKTMIICSSYSGNTEETLAAYEQACEKNARVVCVTSGGQLAGRAKSNGHTLISIPAGYPPRSAIGFLTIPILNVLRKTDLIKDPESSIMETIEVLRLLSQAYRPGNQNNLAIRISQKLHGTIPLIYSSVDGFEPAAVRWKCQIAENSKVMAFSNVFPELNHNEIMGFHGLEAKQQAFRIIYLKDRDNHPQIQKRMSISRRIFEKETVSVTEVTSQGESSLARLFSLIFLGDMVSFYLAMLNEVDPTPVASIEDLKRELSRA